MANSVEVVKANSNGLRGNVAESIDRGEAVKGGDATLVKFHGIYMQEDRDLRGVARDAGAAKEFFAMVRTRIPGGILSAEQYLIHDRMADAVGNGALRITSRQGFEMHYVGIGNLRSYLRALDEFKLTSWAACGDVVRNVVATPVPLATPAHREARRLALELAAALKPQDEAYLEVWINGEKQDAPAPVDPFYGATFLPRKFKIAVAVPPRNDVDVFTHDIGFVAHVENDAVTGYTILVGGGMGMTHGKQETYPVLAKPLFFVRPEHAVAAAEAIVTTQRDYGNRENRKRARLKYLIETRGVRWFRAEVESRLKQPTEQPREITFDTMADPLDWNPQGDGKLFLGVRVENGRIRDYERVKYRTAFRELVTTIGTPVRLTPNHNILFTDIDPAQRRDAQAILRNHAIPGATFYTQARRTSMACVALPVCGQALAEAERIFPGVMDGVDAALRELGLAEEPLLVRMTGCPNGCVRPYNADFAFVGRSPGQYAVYIGGSFVGDRLAGLAHRSVAEPDLAPLVRGYLEEFVANRWQNETFSNYWGRTREPLPEPHPSQFHEEYALLESSGRAGAVMGA